MMDSFRFIIVFLLLTASMSAWPVPLSAAEVTYQCEPTAEDEMGPFYRPDAPYRHGVGSGYLLIGTVKSAIDCSPVPSALIELWMAGPHGRYGDDWRASLLSADNGTYYFVSHAATDYASRPPHIHIKVTAEGFAPLVTQHYPRANAGEGLFDLVLIPAP